MNTCHVGLHEGFEIAVAGRDATAAGRPGGDEFFFQFFVAGADATVHFGAHELFSAFGGSGLLWMNMSKSLLTLPSRLRRYWRWYSGSVLNLVDFFGGVVVLSVWDFGVVGFLVFAGCVSFGFENVAAYGWEIQVTLRMKVVRWEAVFWTWGTVWMADEPVPMTATRLPVQSTVVSQLAVCIKCP